MLDAISVALRVEVAVVVFAHERDAACGVPVAARTAGLLHPRLHLYLAPVTPVNPGQKKRSNSNLVAVDSIPTGGKPIVHVCTIPQPVTLTCNPNPPIVAGPRGRRGVRPPCGK